MKDKKKSKHLWSLMLVLAMAMAMMLGMSLMAYATDTTVTITKNDYTSGDDIGLCARCYSPHIFWSFDDSAYVCNTCGGRFEEPLPHGSYCTKCGSTNIMWDNDEGYWYCKDCFNSGFLPATSKQAAEFEAARTAAAAKTVTLKTAKAKKGKKALVTWEPVSEISGYVVAYSTSKKFTEKTTETIDVSADAVQTTLKKLKAGKKYYVRVLPYTELYNPLEGANETVNGQWSEVKEFKAKK